MGGTIGNINISNNNKSLPSSNNININISTPNADSFRRSEGQIGREISERQRRLYRKNT